jgi:hypothetical protein
MTEFGEKQWSTQEKWEAAHPINFVYDKTAYCLVSCCKQAAWDGQAVALARDFP